MVAQPQAQPCPCSSFIFFSHLKIPTNRVKTFISPRPRSLARRRLTAQATQRTGGGRRPWDSNAESIRGQRFESTPLDDNEDERNESGLSAILNAAIDSIWIFKVFKSFGWLLPVVVLSTLLTTGAKAFLTALAVSVVLSAIPLALDKLSGSGESKQKRRPRQKRRRASREEAMRPESKGYRSSSVVVENGSSPGSVGDSRHGPGFGGWEDLDPMEYERLSPKSSSSSRTRRPTMGKEKRRVEVGTRSNEPLLLRLLIAVFPILGSWTKLFW